MKVVQVTSATRLSYGAMRSMENLAAGLRDAGDSLKFFTFRGRAAGQELRSKGWPVQDFRVRIKIDPFAIVAMARAIHAAGAEIVHTHLSTSSMNGALAARLTGVPAVSTVHGMSGKGSFVFSDRLIAVSGAVKTHLISQGVRAEKIAVVYNGLEDVQPPPEARDRVRAEWGAGPDTFVVGTVARVTALKGIYEAIQAAAAVKDRLGDFRFIVIGDGDDLERCRDLAQREGIEDKVKFPGYVSPAADAVSGLDLLLFPSFKEAMGMAIIEAGLCRVPAVAFASGGVPEIISERTGVLVSPGDIAHLSDALLALANDPCRRLAMGEAARAMALDRFSIANMTEGVRSLYASVLRDFKGQNAAG